MANSAERELLVPRPRDEVFSAVVAVDSDAEALRIVSLEEEAGEIAADVDRSWKSFGERIYISVESSGQGGETRFAALMPQKRPHGEVPPATLYLLDGSQDAFSDEACFSSDGF